jgi:hypothetical protein
MKAQKFVPTKGVRRPLPCSPELSISGAKMDIGTRPPDTPPPRAPQLRQLSLDKRLLRDGGLLRATGRSCGRRRVNYVVCV